MRLEGLISSSWIFSRARFLEVACLDLEALAEKRWMNSWSSLIFSSFFLVGLLHLLDHQLAGLVPEIVVSGVELDLGVVDVGDVGADLVEEVPVMGHHDHRVVKVDEKLLQPGDGVQIQVVGGLVEEQDVGVSEQSLGQQHLDLVVSAEILHHRNNGGPAATPRPFKRVAASDSASQPFMLANSASRSAARMPSSSEKVGLGVDGVLFLHDLHQAGVPHHDGIENDAVVVFEVVLLQGRRAAGRG